MVIDFGDTFADSSENLLSKIKNLIPRKTLLPIVFIFFLIVSALASVFLSFNNYRVSGMSKGLDMFSFGREDSYPNDQLNQKGSNLGSTESLTLVSGRDSPAGAGLVVVSLSGAISKPGVYELPAGSRLVDLILRAGGFVPGVNQNCVSKNYNLSYPLKDGLSIYIPFKNDDAKCDVYHIAPEQEIIQGYDNQGDNGLMNINNSSRDLLDTLPGIGEASVGKIISQRPYSDITDLRRRSGLTKKQVDDLAKLITFN